MMFTLRTRLTAIYCTVFCLSTIALECGAYLGLKAGITSLVDTELRARTEGIIDFLDQHIAKLTLPRFQKELSDHAALQPSLLVIEDMAGHVLWRPPSMNRLGWKPGGEDRNAFRTEHSSEQAPLRVSPSTPWVKGRQLRLMIATDLTVPFELLRQFRLLAFLSSPLIFATASLIGYWIGGRALRPVSEMTTAARAIDAANLNDRLSVPNSHDELQQLAETLNGMLARIEDAFRRVNQFTANASHELRTPIAVIRTTAEVALLRPRPTLDSYREALLHILEESEKNTVLLEDMLRLARADSGARLLNLRPLNIVEHLSGACEQLAPLAEDRGLSLRFSVDLPAGSELWVRAESDHLRRL